MARSALVCLLSVATLFGRAPHSQTPAPQPKQFIFFGLDRGRIEEPSFLDIPAIAGAQLKYTWRELEPARDEYDYRAVLSDLDSLGRHGKRLWVQLQDSSFDDRVVNVPEYLRTDPAFHGGVARMYNISGNDEAHAQPGGWVSRRWDPAVSARFAKLLRALGKQLDGRIEGINLPETSVDFGETGKLHPAGFSYAGYLDAIRQNMTNARQAFSASVVMQYANFMPGEWLPLDDRGYLRAVFAHAERIGVAVGNPDLMPYRKAQQNHGIRLMQTRAPAVIAGAAVQDGNLAERLPSTGARITVPELARFAREDLRLKYLFWGTEEPYYSQAILPFLRSGS